ncbi:MAG: ParB/RepB/Spo0J family partition protein [Myxococcales bacterium]|nr:ParB/RepB/Spo0J family partition protein [Myxococcales bacterium]
MASSPRGALGRGLAALIPDDADASAPGSPASDSLRCIPIDRVRANPHQPRHRFDHGLLTELAASIKEHGVIMPIVVRRDQDGWVLVAGERRLRASKLAGLSEIPAVVRGADILGDGQLVLALLENLQRVDLDPIDAAEGYQRLIQEFGLRQEDVARKVGKDRATIANALRLLRMPPAGRDAVNGGQITAGHARALVPLAEDGERFAQALALVINRGLTVRSTESLVRQMLAPPEPKPRPDKGLERLGRELARAVGVKVRIITRRAGGGRVVLDYADGAELDGLVRRLRGD